MPRKNVREEKRSREGENAVFRSRAAIFPLARFLGSLELKKISKWKLPEVTTFGLQSLSACEIF